MLSLKQAILAKAYKVGLKNVKKEEEEQIFQYNIHYMLSRIEEIGMYEKFLDRLASLLRHQILEKPSW